MNGHMHETPATDCRAHGSVRVTLDYLVQRDKEILSRVKSVENKLWILISGVSIQILVQLLNSGA